MKRRIGQHMWRVALLSALVVVVFAMAAGASSFWQERATLLLTLAPASANVNGFDLLYVYEPTDHRKPIVLHGAAQQLALSFGGASIASGGSLSCKVTWTEN